MPNIAESVKVFLAGRHTMCEWRFDSGVGRARIMNEGEGTFLHETFASLVEAKRHCENRLTQNPALVFYLMVDGEIVDTVMDVEYHKSRRRRRAVVYAIVSTVVIALAAFVVSAYVIRLETLQGQTLFVASMVGLYSTMLAINGTNNVDSAILMVFVLLLAAVMGSPIKTLIEGTQAFWPSDPVAHFSAARGDQHPRRAEPAVDDVRRNCVIRRQRSAARRCPRASA